MRVKKLLNCTESFIHQTISTHILRHVLQNMLINQLHGSNNDRSINRYRIFFSHFVVVFSLPRDFLFQAYPRFFPWYPKSLMARALSEKVVRL